MLISQLKDVLAKKWIANILYLASNILSQKDKPEFPTRLENMVNENGRGKVMKCGFVFFLGGRGGGGGVIMGVGGGGGGGAWEPCIRLHLFVPKGIGDRAGNTKISYDNQLLRCIVDYPPLPVKPYQAVHV